MRSPKVGVYNPLMWKEDSWGQVDETHWEPLERSCRNLGMPMLHSMLHSMLGASRAFTGEHSQSSCGLNPRSFTVAQCSRLTKSSAQSRNLVQLDT